jgi:hypothetical protein
MERVLLAMLALTQVCSYSCNNGDNCYAYRGDGSCDDVCAAEICNFDSKAVIEAEDKLSALKSSDCFFTCLESCSIDQLLNSVCDDDCNIPECGFDGGVCGYCSKGCKTYLGFKSMLGDGKCDSACKTSDCFYDGGDCPSKSSDSGSCTVAMLLNQVCDQECATYSNSFDNWHCVRPTQPCAPGCTLSLLQNGVCDSACAGKNCSYDFKDCVSCT